MLFKFDTGATKSAMVTYLEKEDFENYMIVNRNNEESIFNNEYLNYVNNGYNYDKKARRLDVISDVIGIVSGVGAGLFSSRGASTITTTTDFIQDTNS